MTCHASNTDLAQARIKAGFSQQEVASMCGISRQHYSMIERGVIKCPNRELAEKITYALTGKTPEPWEFTIMDLQCLDLVPKASDDPDFGYPYMD